jgi:hypothetical protein
MLSFLKIARPAVVLVALASAGCLKSDDTFTVYPDGSGKVQSKKALLGMMAQMAKMGQMGQLGGPGGGPGGPGGGPGGEKMDPFDMIKKEFGDKVYWTNLKAEDGPAGEWVLSGTGYFEDVNAVKRENGAMSFKKDGDGYVFSMTGKLPDDIAKMPGGGGKSDAPKTPEQEAMEKQMLEMVKGMMQGFDVKVKVVMPGQVKSAEGMKPGEGREALFNLTEKDLVAIMEKKQEPPKEMKVVSGPADPKVDAELAAFKKELADAKVQSEKDAAAKKAEKSEKRSKSDDEKKADGDSKPDNGGDSKKPEKGKKPQDF